jgi:hypothetical protein
VEQEVTQALDLMAVLVEVVGTIVVLVDQETNQL